MRSMRYGVVILPEHRWAQAEPIWRGAEEYGFDHAWTYDHLAWRSLADGPWFGTMPTLTAAAMVTSRIRLGTFVASPNFRHPASFVRELISLDDIADGRFLFGVGAGGIGFDATVLGHEVLPPGRRVERLGEFVGLLDLLLTSDKVDFEGEFFTTVQARTLPGPLQHPRIPFVIAANGPGSMRLVTRFGQGWVTTGSGGDTPDEWWQGVAKLCTRLDDSLTEAGREPASVDRYLSLDSSGRLALSSAAYFRESVARARELGFTDVIVHWPRREGIYSADERVLEEVASDFRQ